MASPVVVAIVSNEVKMAKKNRQVALTLIHNAQNKHRISHHGELRTLGRVFIVLCRHINHEGSFSSDFNIPQYVGHCCNWRSNPSEERKHGLPCLVALPRRLDNETDGWKHPCRYCICGIFPLIESVGMGTTGCQFANKPRVVLCTAPT